MDELKFELMAVIEKAIDGTRFAELTGEWVRDRVIGLIADMEETLDMMEEYEVNDEEEGV